MDFRSLVQRLKLRRSTVTTAVAVAAATTVITASPASAMYIDPDFPGEIGSGIPNCSKGYVCLWQGRETSGLPEHFYYHYGSYNFVNEFGDHSILNYQTGGARALLCLGYNGTNCDFTIGAGRMARGSLTQYNSIKLVP